MGRSMGVFVDKISHWLLKKKIVGLKSAQLLIDFSIVGLKKTMINRLSDSWMEEHTWFKF